MQGRKVQGSIQGQSRLLFDKSMQQYLSCTVLCVHAQPFSEGDATWLRRESFGLRRAVLNMQGLCMGNKLGWQHGRPPHSHMFFHGLTVLSACLAQQSATFQEPKASQVGQSLVNLAGQSHFAGHAANFGVHSSAGPTQGWRVQWTSCSSFTRSTR